MGNLGKDRTGSRRGGWQGRGQRVVDRAYLKAIRPGADVGVSTY